MKIKIFIIIMSILLSSSEIFGTGQSLSENDLKYYKGQNTVLTKKLTSYFDNENPGYQSIERRNALALVDTVTHYPAPQDDCIKDLFLSRYTKVIESVEKTHVETGIVIWNVYNLSYIVKTKDITVAFDLIRLPGCLRKKGSEVFHKNLTKKLIDLCDVLFVSHIHVDHADPFVAEEFLKQGKPVIAPLTVFSNEIFYSKITHLTRDGKKRKLKIPKLNEELLLRIYPGHQAISADTAVDNNFTIITFANDITIAHSGDQAWLDDFKWLDLIYKDSNIDVLMINTWTIDPNRVIKGLKPKFVLPGHINEMTHELISRKPFWESYQVWKNGGDKVIHLFWGEPYKYEK